MKFENGGRRQRDETKAALGQSARKVAPFEGEGKAQKNSPPKLCNNEKEENMWKSG